jgi:hypothetical protein
VGVTVIYDGAGDAVGYLVGVEFACLFKHDEKWI